MKKMNEHLENFEFEKTDFNLYELGEEIKAVFPTCDGPSSNEEGKVVVHFPKGTELTAAQKTSLENIVKDHVPTPPRDVKAEYAAADEAGQKDMIAKKLGFK